jgi:hypothetical protein
MVGSVARMCAERSSWGRWGSDMHASTPGSISADAHQTRRNGDAWVCRVELRNHCWNVPHVDLMGQSILPRSTSVVIVSV